MGVTDYDSSGPFQTWRYFRVELTWIWPGSCTAIARLWFQTSNLIQSHQIQKKQNVAVRDGRVKTLKIYISYFMNWVRHGNSGTFETEPCHYRVARQTLSNLITVSNLIQVAELNGFKRRATSVPNSINWVRHGSGTTFETGLRCMKRRKRKKPYFLVINVFII